MAPNKDKTREEKAVVAENTAAPAPVKPIVVESIYSAKELADNYKVFNTSREIIVVALRQAKKETATFSEAKAIIDKFKYKEVK